MRKAAKIKRLLGNLFGRPRLESTLDAELHAYLEEMTDRKIREGLAPAEARRQAMLEAGGLEQVKEEVRGAWLGNGIETAVRDVRYSVRALRHSPGFTSVVVLTLGLGIGTNLTMFSVMRAVLWRPLPYPAAGRIVLVQVDARNVANAGAAPGELLDLKARSRLLEDLSMISVVDANLDYGGEMEHLAAASVSDDFLPALGVRPVLGRPLDSRIDEDTLARNVLISDALWRRRFGADPTVIGRGVRINNLEIQIAGVLPPDFHLFLPPSANAAERIDIWFSTGIGPERKYRGYAVAARLKPGATLAQANAELQTIAAQFVREHPEAYPDGRLRLTGVRLHDEMTRGARPALFLLACAVGFVLLIACVNVANLMLAHNAARQRELAMRRALGAGSARIVRQLLTESLILAFSAGGAGLILAALGLDGIAKLGNLHLPLQSRIAVDGVALFALGLSVATSLLFGLLPAWRLASGRMSDPLRAGRSETASSGMRKLQRTLVIAEVALSIVPLASGGLMLRTFVNLARAPIGFDPTHVLTARLPMNFRLYPQTAQRWEVQREILRRVGAIPGVDAVSAAGPLPLAPGQITRRVGRADRPGVPGIVATQQTAIYGYLKLVGTPLLAGRDFAPEDIATARPVAIVDERLARRLWPEGALGRHMAIEHAGGAREDLEVIGVTAAVRATSVRDENIAHFVVPYHIYPIEMTLVVKTRQTAASLAPAIQSAVAASRTTRAAFDIRPMGDYVTDSIGDTRFTMWVLAVFAAASVLLAAVGLYGTLAYLIAQRTREFGIRLALGSTVRAIVAMVIREGALLAATGAAIGLTGAAAATRAIRQLLYNVSPFDGVTLFGVVALVALVAVAAAGVPAWRATKIEPVVALRSE